MRRIKRRLWQNEKKEKRAIIRKREKQKRKMFFINKILEFRLIVRIDNIE